MTEDLLLIDWVSITSKIHTPEEIMAAIGMPSVPWIDTKGAHGYKDRKYFGSISIHYNGGPDMGVWLEMSGQGCRTFEDLGHGDYKVLFDLVAQHPGDMSITRLDVAFDDHSGILDISRVAQDTRDGNWVAWARSWQVTDSNKGSAIYIGSMQSDFLVRIYDKARERGRDGEHWIRVELQLRRDRAAAFAALDADLGDAFAGVLSHYVRFVDPDPSDSNRWRWPLRDYWADLIGHAAAIRLYTKPGMEYNLYKCENYVYRQAGCAIDALIRCYGIKKFVQMLHITLPVNKNPKYDQLVRLYLEGDSLVRSGDRMDPRVSGACDFAAGSGDTDPAVPDAPAV